MRTIVPLWMSFLGISLWVSCGGNDKSDVSRAAETCYKYLIEGKYEDYIHAIAYNDSMTEDYRSQMVDLVTRYAAREKRQRGGLVSVRALGDTVSGDVADVFLEVLFGNGTSEEIVLPMIRCGEEWKMQ